MMKKMALKMATVLAILTTISFSTAKATALTERLSSDDTVEINGNIDLFDEDKSVETAEVNYGNEHYVIFYKVVETGIPLDKIIEIDVMATPPDGGEVMNVLPSSSYTVQSDGKVTFPIGFTINMEPKEFYQGPFKIFINHK